ncbi:ABC transporter permease [Fusibacter bizertensis]
MNRILKTYLPFTKGVIQSFMSYGINFFVYILGDLLQTVVLIYIWYAIFNSSTTPIIQGFTFAQMVGYVIISTMTNMLISNEVHWDISHDVQSGAIAMNLIKPVNYQLMKFFNMLGTLTVNFIFLFLPLWVLYSGYNFFTAGLLPSLSTVLIFFVSILLSSLILFFINYLFGLAAFFIEYIFGFIFAKEAIMKLLSGQLIPLSFFPASILLVFNFLPFSSLVYTPTMIYLGKFQGTLLIKSLAIQSVWVAILYVMTQLLWHRAIKRLTILGG